MRWSVFYAVIYSVMHSIDFMLLAMVSRRVCCQAQSIAGFVVLTLCYEGFQQLT